MKRLVLISYLSVSIGSKLQDYYSYYTNESVAFPNYSVQECSFCFRNFSREFDGG